MCFMMAAGKLATADGSVLVARSCDSNSTEAQRVLAFPRRRHEPGEMLKIPECPVSIPQVPETYAYTAIARVVEGEEIEMIAGGINEFQVSSGASTGGWVKQEVDALTPWPESVLGDYVTTLVLQRCRTAREGILLLGELTEKYGARTDNYIVADPQEAWLFEQYQGYHWAAARVPDDCFFVEANSFRLAEINPGDPDNYLCDPDLIPFATKNGLWDPASGQPFHASRAYATNDRNRPRAGNPQPYYSLHRIWRGNMLLKPSANLDPYEPSKEYPLFLQPDRKLAPADFFAVFKDYFAGTDLDEYGAQDDQYASIVEPVTGHYRLAPAWGRSRIIGCPQAVTTWVTQSRAWLPNEVGGLIWGGLGAGAASPHIPWYGCITRTPRQYQIGDAGDGSVYLPDSAYWLFENIGNLMNLFYQGTVDLVKPVWEAFDNRNFARQAAVEETAVRLLNQCPPDAVEYLTAYSNAVASEAWDTGQTMLGRLFTRIALVNNPATSRGYENPKEWKASGFIY